MQKFKQTFTAGLLVIVPLAITLFFLRFVFRLTDGLLAPLITQMLGYPIPGLGLLLTVGLVYLAGIFGRTLLVTRGLVAFEQFIQRLPLVRTIYGASREISKTLFSKDSTAFEKVVLVEYPHGKVLGFVSNRIVDQRTKQEMVAVFVPTPPNPTSGILLFVPRQDVMELNVSVEDGLKMIMSAGVLTPSQVESRNLPD